ncbi:MAG: ferrous iron transport protein A [Leptolyngbyaceae cyanobacterium CRU_2_3]|nr:ferrous iron transport protein A [Leptolyngbyaceae cyanobacterium CRU_2_3]
MSEKKCLRDLAVGSTGRVIGYEKGSRAYKSKLLSMGLTPGTEFTVSRYAPLGDPVEIRVRGFQLSLRKDEASTLFVEEVNEQPSSAQQSGGIEILDVASSDAEEITHG